MSSGNQTHPLRLTRVADDRVWRLTKILFLGSLLLFLINIAVGFLNVITTGQLPRWQVLIHLHGGTIGWITLSLIGVAIWVFTGAREVSDSYVRWLRGLVWLSVLVFGAYIISFGIAFGQQDAAFALLPIFGTGAMVLIWAATVFAVTQLGNVRPLTTVHVLVTGGLLVAAVGATMGVLLGLEHAIGQFLPIESPDRAGAHAGMMDAYILIVASGIVEWFVLSDSAGRWSWPGMAQALAGTIAALIVPTAFLLNLVETLLPVFGILLLVFLAIFIVRMGWRGLRANPLRPGTRAWGFFGTVWLVVYVALFLYLVIGLEADFAAAPAWFGAVFAHSAYAGMMSNLLFGVLSAHTRESNVLPWGEPGAYWLINLGLIAFIASEVVADRPEGAIVMGLGMLLGVATMATRIWNSRF